MKRFGKPIPEDLDARLVDLAARLAGDGRVVALYLFGSRARGEEGPLSDVDVALLLAPGSEESAFDWIGIVNEVLATDEVGLVVLNRAPVAMAELVLREARVLWSRDEARRLDYEQRVRHLYLDLRHYLRAYDRELFARVGAGQV